MERNTTAGVLLFAMFVAAAAWAGCTAKAVEPSCPNSPPADPVENVLTQLQQRTQQLESYQARLEYLFAQPEPFDSTRLMKGVMYYQKTQNTSNLRINFDSLKQDDEKTQKHNEQFIFDGIWLTQIDYQTRHVNQVQQAEPNEPVNAFDLVRRNFPIIGFTKVEQLRKEFEIELVDDNATEADKTIHLHLKVRPDSFYKDDYTSVDVWIDKESELPARIVAVNTENVIYEIKLLKPRVNEKINSKVFDFKIPHGFTVEKKPLVKNGPGEESEPLTNQ
jgi:outer membrane lipoprotein-sorting protein